MAEKVSEPLSEQEARERLMRYARDKFFDVFVPHPTYKIHPISGPIHYMGNDVWKVNVVEFSPKDVLYFWGDTHKIYLR